VWKELRHILRDRQTLAILLLMPLVQVLLFGYALRTDVRDLRVAVVDPTRTRSTAAPAESPRSDDALPHRERVAEHGRARGAVPAPRGGRRDRAADVVRRRAGPGEPTPVLLVTDASDPNSGTTMQSYVRAALADFERELERARGERDRIRIAPDALQPDARERQPVRARPDRARAHAGVGADDGDLALAREGAGDARVLLVSPLRPWQIIVGKVLPYLALGFTITCLVLLAARVVFGVPVRGSVVLLLAESVLFTIVSLSLGVLVAARTTSQRAAMLGRWSAR
jgi:ABC-2 type transport system permease protein